MAELHMKAGDDVHDFKCCFKSFTLQLVSRKQSYFSLLLYPLFLGRFTFIFFLSLPLSRRVQVHLWGKQI